MYVKKFLGFASFFVSSKIASSLSTSSLIYQAIKTFCHIPGVQKKLYMFLKVYFLTKCYQNITKF